MTASQFTGGSFKHVDPSNYSTGKSGSEVTIHWSVADNAPIDEQTAMGERARVEAIRLAMGADKPYLFSGSTPGKTEAPTPAVLVVPPTVPALALVAPTPISSSPAPIGGGEPSPTPPPSTGPLAIGAPAVVGPAGPPASAPAEITDKMMVDSASHHQARILAAAPGDPVSQETAARKIDAAIRTFVPPGQRLFSIPQEKRQHFLDHLAAL